ncbi:MAG: UDP-forming cellulose synthase catalytic subunit [Acidobacteria bacterium]|nr:MAG: UDP-forming cellulose synthase catalytic subunit [Acidobacteriota bacterium]
MMKEPLLDDTSADASTHKKKMAIIIGSVAGGTLLYLSALPVHLETQMAVATLILGLLAITRRRELRGSQRLAFLFLGVYLSMRYFIWRGTTTLSYVDPLSTIAALLLFAAECYGGITYLLGVFVNLDPLRREPVPLPEDPDKLPSVDVFIPSYNEDPELVAVTLMASRQIRYPEAKLNVYLLDDGSTAEKRSSKNPDVAFRARQRSASLQRLCSDLGVHYLTRSCNEHAKAGNINAALKRTDGELVLILDADHVPSQDFLQETVGWFLRDPRLFLVQTPHFFQSPDPIEKNLGTFQRMPSENQMFYGAIQLGLDFWNASFFCGSAGLLKRSCLEEVGGVATTTITEDAETAVALHARGYRSAYLRKPMVAGLQPETFAGFVQQRLRWAQGMAQLFLLKNPLTMRGLSPGQRVCYMSSSWFWFFPLPRLIFLLAPAVYLLGGLKIYNANLEGFLAYAVPHLIASVLVSDLLYGRMRWFAVSELYEVLLSLFCLRGLASVFVNPRSPKFLVTPKGETLAQSFISPLSTPFYLLFLLTVTSLIAGAFRLQAAPVDMDATVITMGWAVFNLLLLVGALGALFERRQLRRSWRMPATGRARLTVGKASVPVRFKEISTGGASLVVEKSTLALRCGAPALLELEISLLRQKMRLNVVIRRQVTRSNGENEIGLEFRPGSLAERAAIVALAYGDSNRWESAVSAVCRPLGPFRSALFLLTGGAKNAASHATALVSASWGALRQLFQEKLGRRTERSRPIDERHLRVDSKDQPQIQAAQS